MVFGEVKYMKNRIGDINVNKASYKKAVLKQISTNKKLTPTMKARLLATAIKIKPNSFTWRKSWDVGKIYSK